jgi:hypothetical protein
MNSTIIRLGFNGPIFSVLASEVRISGIYFDGNGKNTTKIGAIRIGEYNSTRYKDIRIDNCEFFHFGTLDPTGDLGYPAIFWRGFSYGVIDNNIFNDCSGEIITSCADWIYGDDERSQEFGLYDNGTIYVENNTFNFSYSGGAANIIDGNSSCRFTARYNTINTSGNFDQINSLFELHGTCIPCSGGLSNGGDTTGIAIEVYENTINNNVRGGVAWILKMRGGRALIYNNTINGYDVNTTPQVLRLTDYRAFAYVCPNETCYRSTHPRGYSDRCHDYDEGYTTEGRTFNKTILAENLDSSKTSINVVNVADFPTYGGSSTM